jgi:methoxymalonate biosynthesis acyl carrier protein
MELNDIIAQLRQFIRAQFKIAETDGDFADDVHLFDYGYIDSFGAVTLTSYVENNFGIRIKDTDMIAFPLNTVHDIAHFVVRRRNGEI